MPDVKTLGSLLCKNNLSFVVTQVQQIARIGEVEELLARTVLFFASEVRQEIVAVEVDLEGLFPDLMALFELFLDVGLAEAREKGGIQSIWEMISFETCPGSMTPGHLRARGTR